MMSNQVGSSRSSHYANLLNKQGKRLKKKKKGLSALIKSKMLPIKFMAAVAESAELKQKLEKSMYQAEPLCFLPLALCMFIVQCTFVNICRTPTRCQEYDGMDGQKTKQGQKEATTF